MPSAVPVPTIYDDRGWVSGNIEVFTANAPVRIAVKNFAVLESSVYMHTPTGLAIRPYAKNMLNPLLVDLQR
jgi:hypothetical protein